MLIERNYYENNSKHEGQMQGIHRCSVADKYSIVMCATRHIGDEQMYELCLQVNLAKVTGLCAVEGFSL